MAISYDNGYCLASSAYSLSIWMFVSLSVAEYMFVVFINTYIFDRIFARPKNIRWHKQTSILTGKILSDNWIALINNSLINVMNEWINCLYLRIYFSLLLPLIHFNWMGAYLWDADNVPAFEIVSMIKLKNFSRIDNAKHPHITNN